MKRSEITRETIHHLKPTSSFEKLMVAEAMIVELNKKVAEQKELIIKLSQKNTVINQDKFDKLTNRIEWLNSSRVNQRNEIRHQQAHILNLQGRIKNLELELIKCNQ